MGEAGPDVALLESPYNWSYTDAFGAPPTPPRTPRSGCWGTPCCPWRILTARASETGPRWASDLERRYLGHRSIPEARPAAPTGRAAAPTRAAADAALSHPGSAGEGRDDDRLARHDPRRGVPSGRPVRTRGRSRDFRGSVAQPQRHPGHPPRLRGPPASPGPSLPRRRAGVPLGRRAGTRGRSILLHICLCICVPHPSCRWWPRAGRKP